MKSVQNAEVDKVVEVVVVAKLTIAVADPDADITNVTTIAVRSITRI